MRTILKQVPGLALVHFIVLFFVGASVSGQEGNRSERKVSSAAVGHWKLSVRWGKDGDAKTDYHKLVIRDDLSGTIGDAEDSWSADVRNLKINGDAFAFGFHYAEKEDLAVTFEGKVQHDKIVGSFTVAGVEGKVIGKPADPSSDRPAKGKRLITDAYQARSFTGSLGIKMPYRLFVPANYNPKKKYPIVLFHHGGGGTGNDNRSQLGGACTDEWIGKEFQDEHACFIVAPQFPDKKEYAKLERRAAGSDKVDATSWVIRTVHEVLDQIEREFSIDKNREYVTGLSFGADCAWFSIFERPSRFAAAVPICGGYTLDSSAAQRAKKLAELPLWIFHGDADQVVSVQASVAMVKALKEAGREPRYTQYPGVGHYCWDRAYRDPELIKWLFSQAKQGN